MKKTNEQVLTFQQIQLLFANPAHPSLPKRNDKLLETIILMAYLGLRVSEAINFTGQTIQVEDKQAFIVHGKGNKQRLVFNLLNNPYITRKTKLDPNKVRGKTISRVAVGDYLQKKSTELKLTGKITPHTLRRSFASILNYDLGLDSASIQQLLGHSQFRTTERYLKKDPRFLLTNLQRKGFCL